MTANPSTQKQDLPFIKQRPKRGDGIEDAEANNRQHIAAEISKKKKRQMTLKLSHRITAKSTTDIVVSAVSLLNTPGTSKVI